MTEIPDLLNAVAMTDRQHVFNGAPIVLISHFLNLAPPDTFPNGSDIERIQSFVICFEKLQVPGQWQKINAVTKAVELICAFEASPPERLKWIGL